LLQIKSQIRSNIQKHKLGGKQLVQIDGSLESMSDVVLETEGVDWAAIVDETTADDINKEEKAKPKEDETDKPEESSDKGKSIVDLQKTLEDSAKDKKAIEKADLEKKSAEKFASNMAGASDAASEDVEIADKKKSESTVG
jgi:hypothetical protein